jgi:hypothetical protein
VRCGIIILIIIITPKPLLFLAYYGCFCSPTRRTLRDQTVLAFDSSALRLISFSFSFLFALSLIPRDPRLRPRLGTLLSTPPSLLHHWLRLRQLCPHSHGSNSPLSPCHFSPFQLWCKKETKSTKPCGGVLVVIHTGCSQIGPLTLCLSEAPLNIPLTGGAKRQRLIRRTLQQCNKRMT